MSQSILLITATPAEGAAVRSSLSSAEPLELPWGGGWRGTLAGRPVVLAHLGVGKVNTAAGLALALRATGARAAVQFGIAGAFVDSVLPLGSVAAASSETHSDSGAGEGDAYQDLHAVGLPLLPGPPPRYNEFPTDAVWTGAVHRALGIPMVRFATSERITATRDAADSLRRRLDVAVESMEGAAAAQVCLAMGARFLELRGISNVVGVRDRAAWRIDAAVRAVSEAAIAALPLLGREA
jgi:futalosine hydrolase